MLFANGSMHAGPFEMRTSIGIDRAVRIFAIDRTRSIYDSRCVPAAARPGAPLAVVTCLIAGDITVLDGPRISAPQVLVTSERWFDGPERAAFRSSGDPYRAVEVRLPLHALAVTGEQLVLDPTSELVAAVERYAELALDRRSIDLVQAATTLLAALEHGVIRPGAVAIRAPHPAAAKVWRYIASAYEKFDTSPSLKRLAWTSELSLRQAARYIHDLQSELLFPALGWRDTLGGLRLKLATLLLSCEALSIGEVARLVGYRHAEAMTNALQRAGVGSPTHVRRLLLSG